MRPRPPPEWGRNLALGGVWKGKVETFVKPCQILFSIEASCSGEGQKAVRQYEIWSV